MKEDTKIGLTIIIGSLIIAGLMTWGLIRLIEYLWYQWGIESFLQLICSYVF